MSWFQKEIHFSANKRGFLDITDFLLKEISEISNYEIGILHLFIKHTSASLAINENADPTVKSDLNSYFDRLVPENTSYYKHNSEGKDDMPAHIKSVLIGNTISCPISKGNLDLGTWQGIYLCEHRAKPRIRTILATLSGQCT